MGIGSGAASQFWSGLRASGAANFSNCSIGEQNVGWRPLAAPFRRDWDGGTAGCAATLGMGFLTGTSSRGIVLAVLGTSCILNRPSAELGKYSESDPREWET